MTDQLYCCDETLQKSQTIALMMEDNATAPCVCPCTADEYYLRVG